MCVCIRRWYAVLHSLWLRKYVEMKGGKENIYILTRILPRTPPLLHLITEPQYPAFSVRILSFKRLSMAWCGFLEEL